jgi:hypothetical protein
MNDTNPSGPSPTPSPRATTARTLAQAATGCIVLGLVIASPAGAMFLHGLATLFALPSVLMARGPARIFPAIVLALAVAMLIATYPEFREHMADYAARARR